MCAVRSGMLQNPCKKMGMSWPSWIGALLMPCPGLAKALPSLELGMVAGRMAFSGLSVTHCPPCMGAQPALHALAGGLLSDCTPDDTWQALGCYRLLSLRQLSFCWALQGLPGCSDSGPLAARAGSTHSMPCARPRSARIWLFMPTRQPARCVLGVRAAALCICGRRWSRPMGAQQPAWLEDLVLVVPKVAHAPGLVGPGVPHHRVREALLVDRDHAARPPILNLRSTAALGGPPGVPGRSRRQRLCHT